MAYKIGFLEIREGFYANLRGRMKVVDKRGRLGVHASNSYAWICACGPSCGPTHSLDSVGWLVGQIWLGLAISMAVRPFPR